LYDQLSVLVALKGVLKFSKALKRDVQGVEEVVLSVAADNIVKPQVMPPGTADPIAIMIQLAREARVGTLSCTGREYMLAALGLANCSQLLW